MGNFYTIISLILWVHTYIDKYHSMLHTWSEEKNFHMKEVLVQSAFDHIQVNKQFKIICFVGSSRSKSLFNEINKIVHKDLVVTTSS
jgi:hypothetical protein